MNASRRLWIGLGALLVLSFSVLLWVGGEIHRVMPPIPSAVVTETGKTIYTRADIPDSFAYDVAKALDQNQEVLRYQMVPALYDAETVAISPVVPLHPGALRYYEERGYVK